MHDGLSDAMDNTGVRKIERLAFHFSVASSLFLELAMINEAARILLDSRLADAARHL